MSNVVLAFFTARRHFLAIEWARDTLLAPIDYEGASLAAIDQQLLGQLNLELAAAYALALEAEQQLPTDLRRQLKQEGWIV